MKNLIFSIVLLFSGLCLADDQAVADCVAQKHPDIKEHHKQSIKECVNISYGAKPMIAAQATLAAPEATQPKTGY